MKWNFDHVADQKVIFTDKKRSLSLLNEDFFLHILKIGTILFKILNLYVNFNVRITHLTQRSFLK